MKSDGGRDAPRAAPGIASGRPHSAGAPRALDDEWPRTFIGYGDGAVRLLTDAGARADAILQEHPETLERFERVAELIDGFAPYGLELLASTH